MTGQAGGWPLTVFLTPDQIPIFTGTYFPKERRYGMPAFREVLVAIDQYYRGKGDEIRERGASLVEALGSMQTRERRRFRGVVARAAHGGARAREMPPTTPSTAASAAGQSSRIRRRSSSCSQHGHAHRAGDSDSQALAMVTQSLDCMAQRGLYDHLGGGFFRYSVDRFWSIPHFEKMLYDNAQLLSPLRRRVRGDGHAALCERRERHGRLGHARHAGRARRLLLDARRRLRARGRQVLRLDARRIRRRARARGVRAREARLRPDTARELRRQALASLPRRGARGGGRRARSRACARRRAARERAPQACSPCASGASGRAATRSCSSRGTAS